MKMAPPRFRWPEQRMSANKRIKPAELRFARHMKERKAPDTSYLCGQSMGKDRTRDHVPPRSFFPESLRKLKNFSKLDGVSAHRDCNRAYMLDEQYFFQSV